MREAINAEYPPHKYLCVSPSVYEARSLVVSSETGHQFDISRTSAAVSRTSAGCQSDLLLWVSSVPVDRESGTGGRGGPRSGHPAQNRTRTEAPVSRACTDELEGPVLRVRRASSVESGTRSDGLGVSFGCGWGDCDGIGEDRGVDSRALHCGSGGGGRRLFYW